MSSAVLDASAFLAFLNGEEGSDMVRQAIAGGAYLSAINWAEVLSKLADYGINPAIMDKSLRQSGLIGGAVEIVIFSESDALAIAELRKTTRSAGLSLGDRACLGLAITLRLPAITADRCWALLPIKVKIKVIR